MKKSDVPQDLDPAFEGGKKLCYAVGEDGRFEAALSSGWHVEATVKELAWQVIRADLEQTRARVAARTASPLEYFMKARQMDPGLLALNMGLSRWRVSWHLRPKVFAKLSLKWLSRYAECLGIESQLLQGYRGQLDVHL